MKFKHIIILVFIVFGGCTEPSQRNIDVLFLLHQNGEAQAIMPVLARLRAEGVSYEILAFGCDLESMKMNENTRWVDVGPISREDLLPLSIIKKMTSSYKPKLVISGMSAKSLDQLLGAFKQLGAKVYAYYDNLDDIRDKPYVKAFLRGTTILDGVLIPSSSQQEGVQSVLSKRSKEIMVVGQPSFDEWKRMSEGADKKAIRETFRIAPNDKVIVFAGGYDPTYEEAFRVFVSAVKEKKGIVTLVTYHPATDGALEKLIIQQEGAQNIHVVDAKAYKTSELFAIADLVATHKSSVGWQAAFLDIPVLYVADPSFYGNQLIEEGVAKIAFSKEGIQKAMEAFFDKKPNFQELKNKGIIPENSVEKFSKAIVSFLEG